MKIPFFEKLVTERFGFQENNRKTFLGNFSQEELENLSYYYQVDRISFNKYWNNKVKLIYKKSLSSMDASAHISLLMGLHRNGGLQAHFDFLSETYHQWRSSDEIFKLQFPLFKTRYLEFDEVYEQSFKHLLSYRAFCLLLRNYGIGGLNNIYIAREFIPLNTDICKNLPLEKPLIPELLSITENYGLDFIRSLANTYTPRRTYHVLSSLKSIQDMSAFFQTLDFYWYEVKTKNIHKILPPKPKSYIDIIKKISLRYFTNVKMLSFDEIHISPDTTGLHGFILGDYSINIPQTLVDLEEISFAMNNCIRDYAHKLSQKQSFIFTLKQDNSHQICVELSRSLGDNFMVKEAKGRYNKRLDKFEMLAVEKARQLIVKSMTT